MNATLPLKLVLEKNCLIIKVLSGSILLMKNQLMGEVAGKMVKYISKKSFVKEEPACKN
jgi:hypothetical protein